MKIIRTLIGILAAIGISWSRYKANKRATRAAFRIALNGCRV